MKLGTLFQSLKYRANVYCHLLSIFLFVVLMPNSSYFFPPFLTVYFQVNKSHIIWVMFASVFLFEVGRICRGCLFYSVQKWTGIRLLDKVRDPEKKNIALWDISFRQIVFLGNIKLLIWMAVFVNPEKVKGYWHGSLKVAGVGGWSIPYRWPQKEPVSGSIPGEAGKWGSYIGRSWQLLVISTGDTLEPCYLIWIQHKREGES